MKKGWMKKGRKRERGMKEKMDKTASKTRLARKESNKQRVTNLWTLYI